MSELTEKDILFLLYRGLEEDSRGKLIHGYLEIPNPKNLTHEEVQAINKKQSRWAFSRPLAKVGPGTVIEIVGKVTEGEITYRASSADFFTLWPDQDERQRLRIRSEVAKDAAAARKQSLEDPMKEALEVVRQEFRKARGQHKSFLLARVVAFITS